MHATNLEIPIVGALMGLEHIRHVVVRAKAEIYGLEAPPATVLLAEFSPAFIDSQCEQARGIAGCDCPSCEELGPSGIRLVFETFRVAYAKAEKDSLSIKEEDRLVFVDAYEATRAAIRERADALGVDFDRAEMRGKMEFHRRQDERRNPN